MDFDNTIENIRNNISILNEELTGNKLVVEKKKKVTNAAFFEKKQLDMLKRSDTRKLKKIAKGELVEEDIQDQYINLDELNKKLIEDESLIYLKPWNKLELGSKKNRIDNFVENIKDLEDNKQSELKRRLHILLNNNKLTARYIDYDSNQGKISNIKKLSIDSEKKEFNLTI